MVQKTYELGIREFVLDIYKATLYINNSIVFKEGVKQTSSLDSINKAKFKSDNLYKAAEELEIAFVLGQQLLATMNLYKIASNGYSIDAKLINSNNINTVELINTLIFISKQKYIHLWKKCTSLLQGENNYEEMLLNTIIANINCACIYFNKSN